MAAVDVAGHDEREVVRAVGGVVGGVRRGYPRCRGAVVGGGGLAESLHERYAYARP